MKTTFYNLRQVQPCKISSVWNSKKRVQRKIVLKKKQWNVEILIKRELEIILIKIEVEIKIVVKREVEIKIVVKHKVEIKFVVKREVEIKIVKG